MTSRPFSFIVLTYLWTWFFWGLLVATGKELTASAGTMVLFGLGGIGPMVSALLLLFKVESPRTRAAYWRRLCDPRLIGLRGALFFILFLAFVYGLTHIFSIVVASEPVIYDFPQSLAAWATAIVMVISIGPLPEEMGWRGYALEPLQSRFGTLPASMILGLVWLFWHIPLFLIPGTYQYNEIGLFTFDFWMEYAVDTVALTIVMTAFFNFSRGSIILAILIHASANFIGEATDFTAFQEYNRTLWTVVAAIAFYIYWSMRKSRLNI